MILVSVLSLCSHSAVAAEDPAWKVISTTDGIVVSRRDVPDMPIHSFRGEAVVDVSIAHMVAVQRDPNKAREWVDLLHEIDHRMVSDTVAHIYMRYALSWPLQDRDYVAERAVSVDPDEKIYRISYRSLSDPQWPLRDCCVRATIHGTYWQYSALADGRTRIEVEVLTDPGGSVPRWLVNWVQKSWPYHSITRLTNRASQPDIIPVAELVSWQP